MLDDNVTVTTTKDNPQIPITQIAMKYEQYFAKLKTDTPVTGQCYVDACISIILEKLAHKLVLFYYIVGGINYE